MFRSDRGQRFLELTCGTSLVDRLLRPSLETSYHPAFPQSQYFTTFSDPALTGAGTPGEGTHYTFASSSCVKPGFPYTGPGNKLYTKGATDFLRVAERVGVRFMLFVGDTIYADVPWYSGAGLKNYFKHWRQFFGSPEVKAMVERIRESAERFVLGGRLNLFWPSQPSSESTTTTRSTT